MESVSFVQVNRELNSLTAGSELHKVANRKRPLLKTVNKELVNGVFKDL